MLQRVQVCQLVQKAPSDQGLQFHLLDQQNLAGPAFPMGRWGLADPGAPLLLDFRADPAILVRLVLQQRQRHPSALGAQKFLEVQEDPFLQPLL